jgi:epoxyqueuosine reductase
MEYLGRATPPRWQALELARQQAPQQGLVSLYARGRDYHKVLRRGLQALARRIADAVSPLGYRVFTDSAPVLEVELAQRSGLGWRGKHTLLLDRQAGSMFFLGEIFLDLALPETPPLSAHCGSCSACMVACPTQAIVAPFQLDARRCISYLTIEHEGSIAPSLRSAIGNRIYGCDDCQLVCPWNRYAQRSRLADFDPREGPDGELLTTLLGWSEVEFHQHTEGTPVRRIGHIRWLRNISVAIGNALRENPSEAAAAGMLLVLRRVSTHSSEIVREHALWAMEQWSGASRP